MITDSITPTVQAIGEINFVGNITPHSWRQAALLRRENGVVYDAAINVLADVCYWYKPTITRDEQTGLILEIKKKFASDKLQKDYEAWASYFGYTKRQVQDAVAFLKQRGLVSVELRTITTDAGRKIPNLVFIEPVVEKIREITFGVIPQKGNKKVSSVHKADNSKVAIPREGIPLKRDIPHDKTGHTSRLNGTHTTSKSDVSPDETGEGVSLKRETNTENTCSEISTEITPKISTHSHTLPIQPEQPIELSETRRGSESPIIINKSVTPTKTTNSGKSNGTAQTTAKKPGDLLPNGTEKSKFNILTCLEYVEHLQKEGRYIKTPEGLAHSLLDGTSDPLIETWLEKKQQAEEKERLTASVPKRVFSTDPCRACLGTKKERTADNRFTGKPCSGCRDEQNRPTGLEAIGA